LPAPDGEDRTSIRPRRLILSFDILGLLAELVDYRLKGEAGAGQCNVGGFGAQGVGFPVEFLGEKIQLAAHALAAGDQGARILDMGCEPVQLFAARSSALFSSTSIRPSPSIWNRWGSREPSSALAGPCTTTRNA